MEMGITPTTNVQLSRGHAKLAWQSNSLNRIRKPEVWANLEERNVVREHGGKPIQERCVVVYVNRF